MGDPITWIQQTFTSDVWGDIGAVLAKAAMLITPVMLLTSLYTWMERRQSAMMQDRIGPNRADIPLPGGKQLRVWGLLHILADGLKFIFKEDIVPKRVNRVLFTLAPLLALAPVVVIFAVVPFGPGLIPDLWDKPITEAQLASSMNAGTAFRFQVADLSAGFLVVFAFGGLGVFGASLAGFGSHNKWTLLGGLRASAQMISYEITLGLAAVGALLIYGTLDPMNIVQQQSAVWKWGIVMQPVGFLLFLTAAIAEGKRAPFDIPEGESEIMGYNIEYSGMRWGIFFLGEFMEIVLIGALVTTLFLGGWQVPGLTASGIPALGIELPHLAVVLIQISAFWAKVFLLGFLQIAIRWTLPRLRYDQLMRLGWQGMLPASLINVVVTAVVLVVIRS